MPGPQFVEQEVYAAGGASDVRPVPAAAGARALTLYIPGSAMWYRLWIDAEHRLWRELIVNPGHRIERSFAYEVPASPAPRAAATCKLQPRFKAE